MGRSKPMSTNMKVFWIIFSIILSLAVIYMFVVIYFYYISPNNISLKLKIWPFNSDDAIAEMYVDTTVKLEFETQNPETNEVSTVSIVGVNIKENGVIVTLYDQLRYIKQDSPITVTTSNGIFAGDFVYGDMNYNLALIKCKNKEGKSGSIKIPYVEIAQESDMQHCDNLFVISAPDESKKVRKGSLVNNTKAVVPKYTSFSNVSKVVDYVMKDCYLFNVENAIDFTRGVVYNKSGNVFGLSAGYVEEASSSKPTTLIRYQIYSPVYNVNHFYDKAMSAYQKDKENLYQNSVLQEMKVVDLNDMTWHKEASEEISGNENGFYFSETREWKEYTSKLEQFIDNRVDSVFLVDDFMHNDETVLEAGNNIVSIKIGAATYKTTDKLALANVLYATKDGQKIILNYTTVDDTATILSKEFVI